MQFAEDSEPDPEPTFQECEGFTIRLAPEHSLWSHVIWNSGKRLCELIRSGQIDVRGKKVYELGCGAALPSLVSARMGASLVVAAEYPDRELLDNVNYNFDHNLTAEERAKTRVVGHIWGRDGVPEKFDLIYQTDLVFNHTEQKWLAKEILDHLAENGVCHVLFSHHRPNLVKEDMRFLDICREMGLQVTQRETIKMPRMFPEDDQKYAAYPLAPREEVKWFEVRLGQPAENQ